ncbi:MAG: hypothetical protein QNK23_18455 [Crocinitomicaceae bacterium]|nr:hypothetical protein [Crocinitomicaceae bacterium]
MGAENNIWKRSDSALVVVDYTSLDELKKYREAIRNVGINVNNCSLLAVVPTKKERLIMNQQSLAVFISEKDINLLGQLKNPEAQNILKQKFSLLIMIGDKPKRLSKVLMQLNVDTSIGLNCTINEQDVNLKTEVATPSHLINFAKQTLEKII